jgi:hypothetical protein
VVVRGNGSRGRTDLSMGDQLEQRAAMGGKRERAELKVFETLLAKTVAAGLVRQLLEEAAAHGVDVWTKGSKRAIRNDTEHLTKAPGPT